MNADDPESSPAGRPSAQASGRAAFDAELGRVQDEVVLLGSLVEQAITRSIAALRARDVPAARAVDAGDELINRKRFEVEEGVIALMATQQPVARDLRRLTAFLFTVTDLERIGDYAAEIARVVIAIAGEPLIKPLIDIPRMAETLASMLRRAMDALISQNATEAEAIARVDEEVRALYRQVYRELIALMLGNARVIEQATHLLSIAYDLERAADHVQNICERTIFAATGRLEERTHSSTV
ncbi:MAG: phosphate signaling complex protein PhoU [Chloroflexi bacterium]|nr:phosphate signaling complex protein PhoU [Chloroflexota bacterium]